MDWKQKALQPVGGREWRESIKRFMGDPALARQYLPVARTILGGLIQQLRLGGIEYGHRIVNLPDGARIRVIHNSGINIIDIFAATFPSVSIPFTKGTFGFAFFPATLNVVNGWFYSEIDAAAAAEAGKEYFRSIKPFPADWVNPLRQFGGLPYAADEEADTLTSKEIVRDANIFFGNQFIFKEGVGVISWWHSPCMDGPLTHVTSFTKDLAFYTPFVISSSSVYELRVRIPGETEDAVYYPKLPFMIYQNGGILLHDTFKRSFIGGIGFCEYGLLIVELTAVHKAVLAFFNTTDLTYKQLFTLYESDANTKRYSSGTAVLKWPWRFNTDSTKLATIVGFVRAEEGIPFKGVRLIEFNLDIVFSEDDEGKILINVEVKNQTKTEFLTKTKSVTSREVRAESERTTLSTISTLWQAVRNNDTKHYIEGGDGKIPYGLRYKEDTLSVFYVRSAFSDIYETISDGSYSDNINLSDGKFSSRGTNTEVNINFNQYTGGIVYFYLDNDLLGSFTPLDIASGDNNVASSLTDDSFYTLNPFSESRLVEIDIVSTALSSASRDHGFLVIDISNQRFVYYSDTVGNKSTITQAYSGDAKAGIYLTIKTDQSLRGFGKTVFFEPDKDTKVDLEIYDEELVQSSTTQENAPITSQARALLIFADNTAKTNTYTFSVEDITYLAGEVFPFSNRLTYGVGYAYDPRSKTTQLPYLLFVASSEKTPAGASIVVKPYAVYHHTNLDGFDEQLVAAFPDDEQLTWIPIGLY